MAAAADRAVPPVRTGRLIVSVTSFWLLLAVGWAASQLALGHSYGAAAFGGGLWAAIMTAFFTVWGLRRRTERLRQAPPDLTMAQRRAALDASLSGPVPEDPAVRREALRLTRAATSQSRAGARATSVVLVALLSLAGVVAGLVGSRWWWACAALFAVCALSAGWTDHRRRRRRRQLEQLVDEPDRAV